MKHIHHGDTGRILISVTGTSEGLEIGKRDSYFRAVIEAKGCRDGRVYPKTDLFTYCDTLELP